MFRRAILIALLFGAASTASHAAETYVIDPNHTQVRFGYSHFGFANIVGMFTGVTGTIVYDTDSPEKSTVEAVIPIQNVHTGVSDLEDHLRSADFFEVERYPQATFKSTAVEKTGEHSLRVQGELNVKGMTHAVSLDVTIHAMRKHLATGRAALGLDAHTTLVRTELGVGKYAPNVSDQVDLQITVEANVPKPQ